MIGKRTYRVGIFLAAVAGLLVGVGMPRVQAEALPDRHALVKWLQTGVFDKLDRRIAAYQIAFEHGRRSDQAVEYALKSFANSDPALLAAINLWAAQAPDFYAPAAARGIYNWHLGTMATNAGNASAPEQQKVAEQFFAEAARDLEAALAIEPNLSTAYAVLIDIEIQRGAHDRAFEQLRRGLEQQPRSFVIREQYLDGLVPWRNTHMSQSQALAKLDEFVADARVSAGLYPELRALGGYDDYVRSQLGQRSGQLDQATAAIESAMAKGSHWKYDVQKGRLLRARDRCAPAMAAYDTALSARPDVAWVHDLLADARHCLGQTVAALEEWDRALTLDVLHAPSLMSKARLLRDLGRYEEARAELDKAALFGAADPELRAMRGDLLVNYLNRPAAAIEDLRIATDQRPEQLSYWLDYGTALVKANRCDAVAALATYLSLCRGNPVCSLDDLEWAAGSIEDVSRADCQS